MAGLFDIFSNKNAEDAAQAQIAGLQQGYGAATGNINQGIGAIQQGFGGATDALRQGYAGALPALTTNYGAALQPFLQNYGTAQQGTTALGNALGLNGPQGSAAATAAFQNNPGYQFQLQQGNENLLRNAARTGSLASGGTNVDLQNLGQGLANQSYQQYVQNLQPFLGQSSTAAAGIGNIYTGLGQSQANLATGVGTGLANLSTGQGGALAGQYGNLANLGYSTATGQGNAQANADLANNNASANMWNAILQGGKLVMGAAGGMGGGGGGAFTASDARVKDDIEPIGNLFDGTNVYRYRYKGDDVPRIGLMAQEVERRYPDAVKEFGGVKAVDYGRATEYAAKLSRFLDAA